MLGDHLRDVLQDAGQAEHEPAFACTGVIWWRMLLSSNGIGPMLINMLYANCQSGLVGASSGVALCKLCLVLPAIAIELVQSVGLRYDEARDAPHLTNSLQGQDLHASALPPCNAYAAAAQSPGEG